MSFLALEVIGGITFLGKRGSQHGVRTTQKSEFGLQRRKRKLFFGDLYWLAKKKVCAPVYAALFVSTHAMLYICTCVAPEVSSPRRAP